MRRGLYVLLMVVMVLRSLTGAAMAAGGLPSWVPQRAHQVQENPPDHRHGDTPAAASSATSMAPHVVAVASRPLAAQHSNHAGKEPSDELESDHDHDHDPLAATPMPMSSEHTACDPSTASGAAHNHHSAACSACDICHSAMLDTPAVVTTGPVSTGTLLPLTTAQFDSAPAALAIKPPIP